MQGEWAELGRYWQGKRLSRLLEADPVRTSRCHVDVAGLRIDWSRQFIDAASWERLAAIADDCELPDRRRALFAGDSVNRSENRPALHMALRGADRREWTAAGEPAAEMVRRELAHIGEFVDRLHRGEIRGATGRPIRQVLSIGIGGSHLGPEVVATALPAGPDAPSVRFLSNVDPAQCERALAGLDPAETLVMVVSKTFTSLETMTNARVARRWLAGALGEAAVGAHFVAVSANEARVAEFGIEPDRLFRFWDWVGGRYSVWSAAGLAAAVHLGMPRFREFLAGAAAMDEHFETAPMAANAPVVLGLLDMQSILAFGWPAWAVVPYADRLRILPGYLQQLVMESNGKGVTQAGEALAGAGGPLLLGGVGTDAQHAFFQLLHQGPTPVPVDFIASARPEGDGESEWARHRTLLANCLAQAEALTHGRDEAAVRRELEGKGLDETTVAALVPQKTFPGSRPSTMILMERLAPHTLGALIALYEHRVFVQACVLDINPFDQMGVELGKVLAGRMGEILAGDANSSGSDAAVKGAVAWLREQWGGKR